MTLPTYRRLTGPGPKDWVPWTPRPNRPTREGDNQMSDEIRLVEVTCPHCKGNGCEECEWVGIWAAPIQPSTETDAREQLRRHQEYQ